MDQTLVRLPMDAAVDRRSFGGVVLDHASGFIRRPDGTEVSLRPKSAEVLRVLAENGGQVVSRELLMEAAWPGVFVTDDNITQCIGEIRRALGEQASRLLRTLPKRGYMLVSDAGSDEADTTDKTAKGAGLKDAIQSSGVRPTDRPSIAVLPFVNLSCDAGQEAFSDGLADEVISHLARIPSLFVIARSSSFSYKGGKIRARDIARDLAVRYLLEGSVRRDRDCILVTARLVDGETEISIWAGRYVRDLSALLSVHDEIAQSVAAELASVINKAERERAIRKPRADLSAWEAYQRGIWHISADANNIDLDLGVEFFRQAVALDPLLADAHAMLARYCVTDATRGGDRPQGDALMRAEVDARAALRLDPDNAGAHSALAWIFSNTEGSLIALEHAERAITSNPTDPSGYLAKGHILVFAHRGAEAREVLNAALRLDPRGQVALGVRHHLAVSLYLERDYESAVMAARHVIRGYPDFPRTYPYLVASLSHLGRADEARSVLKKAMSVASGFLDLRLRNRPSYVRREDHEHMLDGLRRVGWQG